MLSPRSSIIGRLSSYNGVAGMLVMRVYALYGGRRFVLVLYFWVLFIASFIGAVRSPPTFHVHFSLAFHALVVTHCWSEKGATSIC
jgi:hypothetical protein